MNDEKYDYHMAVRSDVDDYLKEHAEGYIDDSRRDELFDAAVNSDSVTGNASGSYTMSSWKAESCLCHNFDLLMEATDELGDPVTLDPESLDVTIRFYMLGQVFGEAVEAWNKAHPETDSEEDLDETETEQNA